MLKMMLAYIVLHYDIQPIGERPKNSVVGDANTPLQDVTLMVKRRKLASVS
jgi:hypothetical protein